MAGTRVHKAGRQLATECVIKAGLIAGDAGRDRVGAASSGLGDEIGIGQKWARHADHIGAAIGQNVLCHLGRVDPVRRDDWDANMAHQLFRDPRECAARNGRRDGRHPRLVPANASVDDGGTRRLDRFG